MVSAPPAVKDVLDVLGKEEDWFTQESEDAKEIPKLATDIANDLHNHALGKKDIAEFKVLMKRFHKLRSDERWQQFRVGFNKLNKVMKDLLELPYFKNPSNQSESNHLAKLARNEHALEADVLHDTAIKLGDLIEHKKVNQLSEEQYRKIAEIADELIKKLNALILLTQQMEEFIKNILRKNR